MLIISTSVSTTLVSLTIDPKVEASFSFDLQYQVTPDNATDDRDFLGNANRDAVTINFDYSADTKETTMSFLKAPINYLALPPSPPSVNATSASHMPAPATTVKDSSLTAVAALYNRSEEATDENKSPYVLL